MNKTARKTTTYFAHIPKTGGTSFTALLDRFFPVAEIFPHKLWPKITDIDAVKAGPYCLFRGHFGGGGIKVLTNNPIRYFTMLRKPELLAHSTYQFVKRKVKIMHHQLTTENDLSFEAFLQHPETKKLATNRMIRYLSFDFQEDPSTESVFLSDQTIQYLATMNNSENPEINDDQRLERAKNFISQCMWFGLLERFDDSLRLLCYQLNWPPIKHTQPLNTYKKNNEMTAESGALLAEMNQHDLLLYELAESIFNQRHQSMLDDLQQHKKSQDDDVDTLLDRHYQASSQIPLSSEHHYGFDQVLRGVGWHRRELTKQEGDYFRWTGPNCSSSLDFWLEAQDYQLQIRINNAISVAVLDQLQLTINDQPIMWTSDHTGVVRILQATVSADIIKNNGLARLGFKVNEVMSHQQAFGSKDERLVGVGVHWIKFMMTGAD